MRLFQFDSKIPASIFITLDQYVSIKYFEPKFRAKNFKIETKTKFVTIKNSNSVYLQFVRSNSSPWRGYTFYAITENESENSFFDKIRLKKLKKQIQSENQGNVLFLGVNYLGSRGLSKCPKKAVTEVDYVHGYAENGKMTQLIST